MRPQILTFSSGLFLRKKVYGFHTGCLVIINKTGQSAAWLSEKCKENAVTIPLL